jgi:hypothetical protein
MGPTAGAGPGTAAPFMGLFDSPSAPAPAPAPAPATGSPGTSGGDTPPHVTLFAGATETQYNYTSQTYGNGENKGSAQTHAEALNQDAGWYAAYDTAPNGTPNPKNQMVDFVADVAAIYGYGQVGNQVDINPARDSHGNIQYDANGNVKYDVDYGLFANMDLGPYQSAKELGQNGANAVLQSDGGHPPAKTEPIVIDAHSGGGQTAFFTALELYQKGYTDINIVGFDMAMTPQERATLEQLGVDVSNATSFAGNGSAGIVSPAAVGLQFLMGGPSPQNINNYYDTYVPITPGDAYNPAGPFATFAEWHGFKDNAPSLQYMQNQNIQESQNDHGPRGPNFVSGDVNLKDKSASLDIGGPKGLGAYVNLSEGQLDLNMFGKHIDIDQGFRNAGKTITRAVDKAKEMGENAGEWVHDKAESVNNWVHDKAESATHWVQDKSQNVSNWVHDKSESVNTWVQDKAQTASNWVQDKTQSASNWVQDKTQSASNWVQDKTSAFGNWLFGDKSSTGSKAGQAMTSGPLGGAKGGAGSTGGQVAGKSAGGAKPEASKSPTGSGTVVSAPKDSPGMAPKSASNSVSKAGSSGKAADDLARPASGTNGTSSGKAATPIPSGGSTAPKSDASKSASPNKPASDAVPKAPSAPGKAADDLATSRSSSKATSESAPKSSSPGKAAADVAPASSSKPAKTSSKAADDIAPKPAASSSKNGADRFHFR